MGCRIDVLRGYGEATRTANHYVCRLILKSGAIVSQAHPPPLPMSYRVGQQCQFSLVALLKPLPLVQLLESHQVQALLWGEGQVGAIEAIARVLAVRGLR